MAELIGWKSKIKFSTFNGRQRSFTPVTEVFDPYATIHATHFRPFTPVIPVTAAFDYVSKFIKKVRVFILDYPKSHVLQVNTCTGTFIFKYIVFKIDRKKVTISLPVYKIPI